MELLRAAFRALQNNLATLLIYAAIMVLFDGVQLYVGQWILEPLRASTPENVFSLYVVMTQIVVSMPKAAADAVLFGRIGRNVDKPMWRVSNDIDSLRLFFGLWLLIRLLSIAAFHVVSMVNADTSDPFTVFAFLGGYLVWTTLSLTFGACIMFYGRPAAEEISQAFSTLGHHIGAVAFISFVGAMFGLILFQFAVTVPLPALLLLSVLDAIVSCLIFTYGWLLCMYHRDHVDQDDDFDF